MNNYSPIYTVNSAWLIKTWIIRVELSTNTSYFDRWLHPAAVTGTIAVGIREMVKLQKKNFQLSSPSDASTATVMMRNATNAYRTLTASWREWPCWHLTQPPLVRPEDTGWMIVDKYEGVMHKPCMYSTHMPWEYSVSLYWYRQHCCFVVVVLRLVRACECGPHL